ncbi:hypothetical protein ACFVUS_18405 [Nocardia sp. NPDC058058]|uniref:hypothetical protein n=1 Tax=Nocardia sp. NPDC058058 TaxID=3346317 RepID=UPI0036DC1E69
MSNTTATSGRSRRRAMRQAGPPVEDGQPATTETSISAPAKPAGPSPLAKAEPAVPVTAEPGAAEAAVAVDTAVAADSAVAAKSEPVVFAKADSAPAADADVRAEASDQESEPKARSRFRSLDRLTLAAAAVAIISALLLAGSGGVFFYHKHQANALHERRAEYIQVARQAVINLSTIKDGTADQDIDRILSVVSGDLKAEYAQNRDLYKQIFQQIKVQSNGTVLAAAIEDEGPDSAHVLVLGQQTVTNAASNQPQLKDYRFRVTVKKDGNGTVTASKLEFVA